MNDLFTGMLVGGFIGFVLGYITNSLRAIKKDLDVLTHKDDRDETGAVRRPTFSQVMFAVITGIVVFSLFQAAMVNNRLNETVKCLTTYNTKQAVAFTGRDQAIKDATQSEIDLWDTYEELYKLAQEDPKKIPAVQEKLNEAITDHKDQLIDVQEIRDLFEYADPDILETCKKENP